MLSYVQQPYEGYQRQSYVYQQNFNNVPMKQVIAENHWVRTFWFFSFLTHRTVLLFERCKKCCTHNFHDGDDCHGCGSAWMCPNCSFTNYAFRSKCLRCQTIKPQKSETPKVQVTTPDDTLQIETTI